jgi:protein disulfide-isomerase
MIMKRALILAGLAAVLAVSAGAQKAKWYEEWDAAVKAAKKSEKPILADFTGSDWCGWCIKLKNEVFKKKEFVRWARKNVVLLELDFPRRKSQPEEIKEQNAKLRDKYGIRGYPTILFLDASGKVLGRSGYLKGGPKKWIESAEQILEGGARWLTDYEQALKLARKHRKPILADFTGSDWCGWCVKLKKEVFDTPEFKKWSEKHVILLELDFPRRKQQPEKIQKQNAELKQKFGIRGFPTIVFLDRKGRKIDESGYLKGGPDAWLADASKKLGIKWKKKRSKTRP